jgi:hypothetical protein
MHTISRNFGLALLFLFALGGCGSLLVDAPVPYTNPEDVKTIGIMAVYVSPFKQPETPVADASTFNKKTDAIENELNTMLSFMADQYSESLEQGLAQQLGVEVLEGSELEDRRSYDRYLRDENKEALIIKGARPFDKIHVASGGINTFPLENGDLQLFIEESPRLRSITRKQARNLEVQAVAFSHTRMVIDQVAPLGKKAAANLKTDIYIYDDKGQLIGHGQGETKPINIAGDIVKEYRLVMDQYPELQNKILTEMTKPEE